MATTKAQQKAVNKYIGGHYDRINLTLPRGQKSTIEAAAASTGESVNAFIQRAILNRIGLTEWPVEGVPRGEFQDTTTGPKNPHEYPKK